MIRNHTNNTIEILGLELKPNESRELDDIMPNTVNVFSDIGRCIITTDRDGKRHFENCGKILAEEGHVWNEYGFRDIIISEAE